MIVGLGTKVTNGFQLYIDDPSFAGLGNDERLRDQVLDLDLRRVRDRHCGFVLSRTKLGRWLYATGGNPEAARLSGINTRADQGRRPSPSAGSPPASPARSSISRTATGHAGNGIDVVFIAFAAVVVGGTSVLGGRGAIWRTVLGLLFLEFIRNGFNLLEVNPYYQDFIRGRDHPRRGGDRLALAQGMTRPRRARTTTSSSAAARPARRRPAAARRRARPWRWSRPAGRRPTRRSTTRPLAGAAALASRLGPPHRAPGGVRGPAAALAARARCSAARARSTGWSTSAATGSTTTAGPTDGCAGWGCDDVLPALQALRGLRPRRDELPRRRRAAAGDDALRAPPAARADRGRRRRRRAPVQPRPQRRRARRRRLLRS